LSSTLSMSEEQWEAQKESYKVRVSSIMIPMDISPGVAKGLLSRIDNMFSEVRMEMSDVAGRKERVDNIIREWEREKANGRNEIERKQNATKAIQNFPVDGDTTNLYEVQRQMTERLAYLQGVIDVLNGKQSRLITITGVMKLEKDLSPYSNIE
jgi:hypothetical protein